MVTCNLITWAVLFITQEHTWRLPLCCLEPQGRTGRAAGLAKPRGSPDGTDRRWAAAKPGSPTTPNAPWCHQVTKLQSPSGGEIKVFTFCLCLADKTLLNWNKRVMQQTDFNWLSWQFNQLKHSAWQQNSSLCILNDFSLHILFILSLYFKVTALWCCTMNTDKSKSLLELQSS